MNLLLRPHKTRIRILASAQQYLKGCDDSLLSYGSGHGSVVVKTAPTETKTLPRPESTETETRPRLLEVETKTRPRLYIICVKLIQ